MEKVGFAEGHSFILDLLDVNSVCFDLGANRGNFASFIEAKTDASVVLVEPVAQLFDDLATTGRRTKIRTIIRSEPGEATINIYPNCCPSLMHLPSGGEPHRELVTCMTLEDIFSTIPGREIGLVKMDIEGAEIDVLKSTPLEVLRRASQYTVEFHDFMEPSLKPGVAEVIRHMENGGFTTIRFSTDNTNVLFVRTDRLAHGVLSWAWLAGPVKYLSGLGRIASRMFRLERPGSV